jgi:predicted DNA-binding protein with PD1-like motif
MLPFVKRDIMDYEIGQTGRVVVMRLHDGDPIYASIESVADKERIGSAAVWVVGGIKNSTVVAGPKNQDVFPLETIDLHIDDAREIVGFGTIFTNSSGQPRLHMHAAIGKGETVIAGCPRKGADCWLVDEVIILEIIGTSARRSLSEKCGLELLSFPEK